MTHRVSWLADWRILGIYRVQVRSANHSSSMFRTLP